MSEETEMDAKISHRYITEENVFRVTLEVDVDEEQFTDALNLASESLGITEETLKAEVRSGDHSQHRRMAVYAQAHILRKVANSLHLEEI